MWNVGCAMLGVGCGMLNVECGMWHVACEMLSGRAGCFYQKHGFPDAHGWVFSRILYSCSAAYCLVLMRRRRNGLPRIFSHAESCMGECHTMGLLGMRKICGNPRDLWATTKRTMR